MPRVVAHASSLEVLEGVWRFATPHPDWTEDDGGEDGWAQEVAWWAIETVQGVVLVDPLVRRWASLDALVADRGGCAAVIRTCHWHQRTVSEAASRYDAEVWAKPPPSPAPPRPFDRAIAAGETLPGGLMGFAVDRHDEVVIWSRKQAVLIFGDAILRTDHGGLRTCPDSWLAPDDGPVRLRTVLRTLTELPIEHVLVSHGPLVLGNGLASLQQAIR